MPPIAVGRVGFHVRDEQGLVIDRPRGSGDWLFIWFHAPVTIAHASARTRTRGPTWALYRPTCPQWFSGVDRTMDTSWFHCDGIEPLVAELRLPCDTLASGRALGALTPLLRELARERLHRDPGWEAVAAALVEATLRRLARVAQRGARAGRSRAPAAPLRELRERVHARLAQRWTVRSLARLAGLSPSRLNARWRATFGSGPIADLIDARLARACWLLESTDRPIAAIAADVGYDDAAHFSRAFRTRLGRPPSAWTRATPSPPARGAPRRGSP